MRNGDVYVVSVDGTQDLGSGPVDFKVGDWLVYNGSNSVWDTVSPEVPEAPSYVVWDSGPLNIDETAVNVDFTHSLGLIQQDVEDGRYSVRFHVFDGIADAVTNVSMNHVSGAEIGDQECRWSMGLSNSATRMFFQLNTLNVRAQLSTGELCKRVTILDNWGSVSGVTSQIMSNRVIVNQANFGTTLGGAIDSTKEYFVDGKIDTSGFTITVPSTGLNISGYNFDVSGLFCNDDNYTMFVSDVGGSGNVIGKDYEISVTGLNSKVYDLTDATGFNAFEFSRINYIDCTSLGEITDYRQGLENGTGRFGGSPSLTLSGTWLGGYRVVTSIIRNVDPLTVAPIFVAGAGFSMLSRFATDVNVDLGALQSFTDFSPINFPNPSTLQFQEMILTRGGVLDPTDANITPNVTGEDLCSYWKDNVGLDNTYVGGTMTLISEVLTTVAAGSTWYDIEGVYLGAGLVHFSSNASGELIHDGISPREFEFTGSLLVEGSSNDSLSVRFNKWDASASAFTPLDYTIQTRTVNALVGGRDVAIFNLDIGGVLDQGDYLKLEVRNNSGNNNVTLEISSFYRVQER